MQCLGAAVVLAAPSVPAWNQGYGNGNVGGLISTWSFLSWDGPNYHIGNGLNLATSSTILIVTSLMLVWMKRDNQRREHRSTEEELAGMTPEEVSGLDWKHPAFRWRP